LYQTTTQLEVNPSLPPVEEVTFPPVDYNYYTSQWSKATKKLILVGACAPDTLTPEILSFLTEDHSTIVLAETISNINYPGVINAIDRLVIPMKEEELLQLQPDHDGKTPLYHAKARKFTAMIQLLEAAGAH